tara:strand:- start:67 stop:288 length:222 start_codon:yes stop_codon:yes gene_type:complete
MGIPNQYNAQPVLEGLSIPEHDYISVTYANTGNAGNDDPTTITYKYGGSSGTTVATLTLTYAAAGRVSSVTRS